jgi:uncharacterized protein
MVLAWYGHLKFKEFDSMKTIGLFGIILLSWGIAFFEYLFQVPANKFGYLGNGGPFTLFQLRIIQEVVSLIVFTVLAVTLFKTETLRWNHLGAFILLIGAVYLVFKK